MKSMFKILLSGLICVAVTQSAFAGIGDIEWIGDRSLATTHQEWSFTTNEHPAYPDAATLYNPYEKEYQKVQALIEGEPAATWEHIPNYYGQEGVWFADELEVRLHIFDTQDDDPDSYKDVVVQAVYRGELKPVTVTATAHSIQPKAYFDDINLYEEGYEEGWKKLEAVWRIQPNPAEEWVCLGLEGTGGAIDWVSVDTICVPEPATILLFGLSGAFLKLKRRRA